MTRAEPRFHAGGAAAARTESPSDADIWWCHPSVVFFVAALGATGAAWAVPAEIYVREWGTPKHVSLATFVYVSACSFFFFLGASATRVRRSPREAARDVRSAVPTRTFVQLFRASVLLTVIGYGVWMGAAVARGLRLATVIDVLQGSQGAAFTLREVYFATIPGITTMTQFGVAAVIVGVTLFNEVRSRAVLVGIGVVFVLGAMRAFFCSERLALIELVVPAGLVYLKLSVIGGKPRAFVRSVIRWFPLIAVLLVVFYFAVFEYFRTWTYLSVQQGASLPEYMLSRLVSYYATSINNGAILVRDWGFMPRIPYFLLEFVWKCPTFGDWSPYVYLAGFDPRADFQALLEAHGNPEFNNPCGLFMVLADLGLVFGLSLWFFAGFGCARLYAAYLRRSLSGLLLYPVFIVAILEVPRILYLSEPRILPSLVLLVPVALMGSRLK